MLFETHTEIRDMEWYNYDIHNIDYDSNNKDASIINQIKLGNATFIGYGKYKNTYIYYVRHKKIPYKVVYMATVEKIVTFLPFDVDEYNKLEYERKLKRQQQMDIAIKDSISFLNSVGYLVCVKSDVKSLFRLITRFLTRS